MKVNPTGYLCSKYEWFLISCCQDMDLENFDTEIPHFEYVLDFDVTPHPWAWTPGYDVMERKPTLQGTYGPSMSAF